MCRTADLTAHSAHHRTARACRKTPKQYAAANGKLAQYEAAERQVHELAQTRCLPPAPPSLPVAHSHTARALASSCAVAGRSLEHIRCHIAHELLLPSEDNCALVLVPLWPRTATTKRRGSQAHTRTARRSASSPFRPLSRRLGLVLQAKQLRPAKNEVSHLRASVCTVVLVPQCVGIGASTHRAHVCIAHRMAGVAGRPCMLSAACLSAACRMLLPTAVHALEAGVHKCTAPAFKSGSVCRYGRGP